MFLYLRTRTAAEGNNQNLYLLICLKIEYLVKLGGFPKPHINIVYLPEHSLYSKIWRVFNFWAFRRFYHRHEFSSVQSFSRVRLFATPWNPSMSALPVHHQLPEFTQTHVHQVGDAIQPSHPLSSSFPPAPNPSQHQSLFQGVNSSHEVAKVLEFQL